MPKPAVEGTDPLVLDQQRTHWASTFGRRADFLGAAASVPARNALGLFLDAGARKVLELGAGQGRDTLLFAEAGIRVSALDYAETGLTQVAGTAAATGLGALVTTVVADVRDQLPFEDSSFDACYAHMLFCMALTTDQIERLTAEVRRVLRPRGLLVYTVRNTSDDHYGAGVAHGDEMWETGGFIVHFFDRALIDRLADGFQILEVADLEEGKLPRRLSVVTMRRNDV